MKIALSRLLLFSLVACLPAVTFGQLFDGSLFGGRERVARLPAATGPHFTKAPRRTGRRYSSGIVPGTGTLLERGFDDFEDPDWAFTYQMPKSSYEQDHRRRYPLGRSENGLWEESAKRGTPDHVARVETPAEGISGSEGALKIQSLNTGIPGYTSFDPQQDDLILNLSAQYGRIPIYRVPNAVVRVWLPPFEAWEQRSGSQFGFRLALGTTLYTEERNFIFKKTVTEAESYWPGMFIQYTCEEEGYKKDGAMLLIRGAGNGGDFPGPKITQTGWWTLGMTVNANGSVSYYASPGVDDLTAADHIATTFPYSYRAEYFTTIFFNITSANDGSTWSTPFIIDDPKVFTAR